MERRATIATEFWHGATGLGLANGFRSHGWMVDQVDVRDFLPQGRSTVSRVEGRLLRRFHMADYNAAILQSVERNGTRLFVTVKGSFVSAATLDALRRRGVYTVNYYPDVEFEHVGTDRSMLGNYDLIATTKHYHFVFLCDLVGADRVAFVHHGYSPLVHRPVAVPCDDDDYDYDLLYVGNGSPYKHAWLRHVVDAFSNRRIAIIGINWEGVVDNGPFAQAVVGHTVTGDFYARMIGRSRINLALHSGPVRTAGWEDGVSTRSFEIPACGGFMLHIDNLEVRKLYDATTEIATFTDPEQLVERIGWFLAHPDERRAIAARGHTRAVPAYSLDVRAGEILAAVDRF